MAHFAKIENGLVVDVIVADQTFIDAGYVGDPSQWIQTSYNTFGDEHTMNGVPLRKNYAGIGFTYDLDRDAFIPPQPYPSWILDEDTCLWNSPVEYPSDDKIYVWNEDTLNWVERT